MANKYDARESTIIAVRAKNGLSATIMMIDDGDMVSLELRQEVKKSRSP